MMQSIQRYLELFKPARLMCVTDRQTDR